MYMCIYVYIYIYIYIYIYTCLPFRLPLNSRAYRLITALGSSVRSQNLLDTVRLVK